MPLMIYETWMDPFVNMMLLHTERSVIGLWKVKFACSVLQLIQKQLLGLISFFGYFILSDFYAA